MSFRSKMFEGCGKVGNKIANLFTVKAVIRKNGVNINTRTGLDEAKFIEEMEKDGFEVVAYNGSAPIKIIETENDYEELESNI